MPDVLESQLKDEKEADVCGRGPDRAAGGTTIWLDRTLDEPRVRCEESDRRPLFATSHLPPSPRARLPFYRLAD